MNYILHVHVYVVVNFSSQVIFFVSGYVNECYCETHKTMNTRNIYGLLLFCEEKPMAVAALGKLTKLVFKKPHKNFSHNILVKRV